jgi:hypothetical protein
MPPAPGTPSFDLQRPMFSKVIGSELVRQTILQNGTSVRLLSVSETRAGHKLELNNGCSFTVAPDFSDASPGTCPQLLPLKVVDSHCE